MSTINRRYDIDWLRVSAIGLLLIYHVAVGFQPWGVMIGFITNEKPWVSLWTPMAMLNIWRIPLLFFVSGMGVYFAIQNRTWKQLLQERAARILIPFVFGTLCIFPVSVYLWQNYYHFDHTYNLHPGHLWFLGNIFVYVVIWSPVFFYLKKDENGKLVTWIKKILSHPFGLLPVTGVFIAEAVVVDPASYALYVMNWHGFTLGLFAFGFGFCFVLSGSSFWNMLLKYRWLFPGMAIILFTYRFFQFQMRVPNYLLAIESTFWIFSVFAFGHKYLNHPGKVLSYLSEAAYPVYILHMIFLFAASSVILPLSIDVHVKFVLVLVLTFAGCFGFYELILRRANVIRPLFGLKKKETHSSVSGSEGKLFRQKIYN